MLCVPVIVGICHVKCQCFCLASLLFKLLVADLIVAIAVGESVSMFSVQVRINVAVAVAVVHPSVPWTWLYWRQNIIRDGGSTAL